MSNKNEIGNLSVKRALISVSDKEGLADFSKRLGSCGVEIIATGGTGDVLAGTIAGFLAQGVGLENAAAIGVYIHGSAGEIVKKTLGDTGMLASDLLLALPRAIKNLKSL